MAEIRDTDVRMLNEEEQEEISGGAELRNDGEFVACLHFDMNDITILNEKHRKGMRPFYLYTDFWYPITKIARMLEDPTNSYSIHFESRYELTDYLRSLGIKVTTQGAGGYLYDEK